MTCAPAVADLSPLCRPTFLQRLSWFVNAMGTALAPFDCFLLLRGRESSYLSAFFSRCALI